ncbi:hypothetical protein S40288_04420 [Stachybotrys chartarum IBT 40288]|nr:hypothetical protein S40288_04420 [Stachybotrys chartarum IBT 40288]
MFNHPIGKTRASQYNDDQFAYAQQQWANQPAAASSSSSSARHPPQLSQVSDRSFLGNVQGGGGGMDWAPASDMQMQFHHDEPHATTPSDHHIQFQGLDQDSAGGGVGRLVAHFENKSFQPPLPPRPLQNTQTHNHVAVSPPTSLPYGGYLNSTSIDRVQSPMESSYGSFDLHQSRVASPIASSPPPMSFGSFHDASRVPSPVATSSSAHFGSLDDFMSSNRVTTPMVASPMVTSPVSASPMVMNPSHGTQGVPGTPGFEIWRPPGAIPQSNHSHFDNHETKPNINSGFLKPPVPSTPKPVMNAGSQFILELNPNSKGKGKAVAKPTKPRVPPPIPPPSSKPPPGLKQEPEDLLIPDLPSSTPINPQQQSPTPLRPSASRPSREQVPAEAWEQFKTTIRSLYLEERKPLKEVMSIMADKYGFQATPKMYKTRFSQWGFVKNNTEDEVKRLLSMKFQRDAEGKVSEFVRNGRVVNLGTYLKRKGVTEYDLVDFELPADLPAHIRCRTPTPPPAPDYLKSPDLLRAQELVVVNMRKAFLHCRQFEIDTDTHVGWSSNMVWGATSSDLLLEANFYFEARDTDQGGIFLMRAFKQLELDLKNLSSPGITELLLGMVNRDPGLMTALCKYLAAYSTTNLERAHPLRLIFTCLYEVQQKHGSMTLSDLLWSSVPTIAEELEAIYGRRHPHVARLWLDLALFYSHSSPERMEKLVPELRIVLRQVDQEQGQQTVEAMSLRYAIAQLLHTADPESEAVKQASIELYNHAKSFGLIFPVRGRPNAVCYHSPLKLDPWTKRCRRRYDTASFLLEKHVGIRANMYFEEDHHLVEHAPDPQEAWAAAMQQMGTRWGYI